MTETTGQVRSPNSPVLGPVDEPKGGVCFLGVLCEKPRPPYLAQKKSAGRAEKCLTAVRPVRGADYGLRELF